MKRGFLLCLALLLCGLPLRAADASGPVASPGTGGTFNVREFGAASTTWTGTHKGELAGIAVTGNKTIPPTGRKVTIAMNYLFRVETGKIVELWETWDEGTLYLKLSQPEPAATK